MPNCAGMGQGWSEDPTTGACVFQPLTMEEWGFPGTPPRFDPGTSFVGSTLEHDYEKEFDPYSYYLENLYLEGVAHDVGQLKGSWEVGETGLTNIWDEFQLQTAAGITAAGETWALAQSGLTTQEEEALDLWNIQEAGITTQEGSTTDLWTLQEEAIIDQIGTTEDLWAFEESEITRQEGETTDLWGIESSRITEQEAEGVTSWEAQKGGLGEAWGSKKGELGYGLGRSYKEAFGLGQKARSRAGLSYSGTVERAERSAKREASSAYRTSFGEEKSSYELALERGELDLDEVLSGLAQARATGQEAYDAAISAFGSQREIGQETYDAAIEGLGSQRDIGEATYDAAMDAFTTQRDVGQATYDAQVSAFFQAREVGLDAYNNQIKALTDAQNVAMKEYDAAIAAGDKRLADDITNKYQQLEVDIFNVRDKWEKEQRDMLDELLVSGIFPTDAPPTPPVIDNCATNCSFAKNQCLNENVDYSDPNEWDEGGSYFGQASCQEDYEYCLEGCG